MATKIIPCDDNIPFSESGKLVLPERKRIQKQLLDMEKQCNGYSFVYTGSCLYCPQGTCTRLENQPCRYPNLIRPSLEACGFDIGLTLSELFDIELKWGKNGLLPEYLMMVSGFLHNKVDSIVHK